MSGTIILGYDIENASKQSEVFFESAKILHDKHKVPWTIYLTGMTVERCGDSIRKLLDNPLLTVGQHTYSHVLLKSVYMTPGDGKPVHGAYPNFFKPGSPVEEIREQIEKTQHIIAELLGIECRGLTGPWGYFRGLVDRPDILQILRDNNIQWIRANARDSRDCQPTPFSEQPFFYTDQGFPEILELGIQGYQDDFYWDRFDDRRYGPTYQDYLLAMLEQVRENDLVWSICSHDNTSTKEAFFQTKGKWIDELIMRAREIGVRFLSPRELHEEMSAPRSRQRKPVGTANGRKRARRDNGFAAKAAADKKQA